MPVSYTHLDVYKRQAPYVDPCVDYADMTSASVRSLRGSDVGGPAASTSAPRFEQRSLQSRK